MADKQKLVFEISADAEDAVRDLKVISTSLKSLSKTARDTAKSTKSIEGEFNGLSKSVSGVVGSLKGLAAGMVSLGAAMKGVEFAQMAMDAEQAGDAFDRMVTEMGKNSVAVFEEIKKASMGLIPDAALKQSAVTAVSLGVPLEKLSQLMEVAVAKSREMGTTVSQAFSDLATGIGRGSPMILDNLGLTIKLGDANERLAKTLGKSVDELTKQEKTLALTDEVIRSGAESVKRYADAGLSARQKMQQLDAEIENLKVRIGSALMPALMDLAEATRDFVDSLNEEDIRRFGKSVETLVEGFVSLGEAVATLNDLAMPDWLGGEDSGFFGTVAKGWAYIADALDMAKNGVDDWAAAADRANRVHVKNTAAQNDTIAAIREKNKLLQKEILHLGDLIVKYSEFSGTEKIVAALESQIRDLESTQRSNFEQMKRLKELGDPYEKAADGAKKAAEAAKLYGEEQLSELKKTNDRRLSDYENMTQKLVAKERKLSEEIRKINEGLVKELAKIDNDRTKRVASIDERIRRLTMAGRSDYKKYVASMEEADSQLAKAKEALAARNFDMYRFYLSKYESLVTEYAGREIEENDKVRVSKEQTARAGIEGLQEVKKLEEQYYAAKKRQAKEAHDAAIAQKKAELEGVKAQIEATKTLIETVKKLGELLTGQKMDIDTSAAQLQIQSLDNQIKALDAQLKEGAKTEVRVDTTQLQEAKGRIEEARRYYSMNGVTVAVDADTTPADFGIEQFVVTESGKEITIETNPEWEKAQAELEAFRNRESSQPIEQEVSLDTTPAERDVEQVKKEAVRSPVRLYADLDDTQAKGRVADLTKTERKTVVVDLDDSAARAKIADLMRPTSSVHTVYVRTVGGTQGYATGGMVHKLSTGGKVPGYDPSGSDSVVARLTRGEYVINAKSARVIGLENLNALNSVGKLPRFADGGSVGGASVPISRTVDVNLNMPDGESFSLSADEKTADLLERYFRKYA